MSMLKENLRAKHFLIYHRYTTYKNVNIILMFINSMKSNYADKYHTTEFNIMYIAKCVYLDWNIFWIRIVNPVFTEVWNFGVESLLE